MMLCRYEAYVDQKYKEHLKDHGKVDSVSNISTDHHGRLSYPISMFTISIIFFIP